MNRETQLLRDVREQLDQAGLRGHLVARDLDTGAQIDLNADTPIPLASLAKIPIAIAVLNQIRAGTIHLDTQVHIHPAAPPSRTPVGGSRFRHDAHIAVEDLLMLAVSLSDNTAADALLTLVPIDTVQADIDQLGIRGLHIRHPFTALTDTPLERLHPDEAHLAYELAAYSRTAGQGNHVWQLDTTRGNAGTATVLTDLLQHIWRPTRLDHPVAAHIRDLLAGNMIRHRITPDFASDHTQWSSKTGTLLNHRHEIGVIEHPDGQTIAITALSTSSNPAAEQPAAEATLGAAARALHDHLRQPRTGKRDPLLTPK